MTSSGSQCWSDRREWSWTLIGAIVQGGVSRNSDAPQSNSVARVARARGRSRRARAAVPSHPHRRRWNRGKSHILRHIAQLRRRSGTDARSETTTAARTSISDGLDYQSMGASTRRARACARKWTNDAAGRTRATRRGRRGPESTKSPNSRTDPFSQVIADLNAGGLVHLDVWRRSVGGPCLSDRSLRTHDGGRSEHNDPVRSSVTRGAARPSGHRRGGEAPRGRGGIGGARSISSRRATSTTRAAWIPAASTIVRSESSPASSSDEPCVS